MGGSPPHLRGKHDFYIPTPVIIRITPAPAGKTKDEQIKNFRSMDHPRTCGENALMMRAGCSTKGSPPHLRGKRTRKDLCTGTSRITPAPAGKTDLCADICQRNKDHPRTCGENMFSINEKPFKEGSPPHLRGKLARAVGAELHIGITPAPAGKTGTEKC